MNRQLVLASILLFQSAVLNGQVREDDRAGHEVEVELPEDIGVVQKRFAESQDATERLKEVLELAESVPAIRSVPVGDAETLASALSSEKLTGDQAKRLIQRFAAGERVPQYFPGARAETVAKEDFVILLKAVQQLASDLEKLHEKVAELEEEAR